MTGGGRFGMVPARAFDDVRMTDSLVSVLGLLATYGNRDGWCHPKLREMAVRRGVSRQAVSAALLKLAGYGYVETRPTERADGGTSHNEYRIVHDLDLAEQFTRPAQIDAPSTSEIDGGSISGVDAPSTSDVDGNKEQTIEQTRGTDLAPVGAPTIRGRDLLFEAVADSCGIDWHQLTNSARGPLVRAVNELRNIGAAPQEVIRRGNAYRTRFDGCALTPMALVKHWPTLDRPAQPAVRGSNRSLVNGARWVASKEGR